jgi:small GTP-binding protein
VSIIAKKKKLPPAYKIAVGGDGGVGKTTLLYRYCEGKFVDTKLTVGVSFFQKDFKTKRKKAVLAIWDLGGQEYFRFILSSYTYGAKAGLVCFALDRWKTFLNIEKWVELMRTYEPELPLILVGTRGDLETEEEAPSQEDIYALIEKFSFITYVKTSSKTGEGVNEPFEHVINELI